MGERIGRTSLGVGESVCKLIDLGFYIYNHVGVLFGGLVRSF